VWIQENETFLLCHAVLPLLRMRLGWCQHKLLPLLLLLLLLQQLLLILPPFVPSWSLPAACSITPCTSGCFLPSVCLNRGGQRLRF